MNFHFSSQFYPKHFKNGTFVKKFTHPKYRTHSLTFSVSSHRFDKILTLSIGWINPKGLY